MNEQVNNSFNAHTFNNMFKDIKIPRVDFESAVKAHKRNLETFTKAQKTYFECAKNMNEKHTNFLKESMEDLGAHWQDMLSSKSLEEKVQAHSERLKSFFEKSVKHGRILTEQLMNSHHDVSSTMQDRFSQGVGEAKEVMKKTAQAKY